MRRALQIILKEDVQKIFDDFSSLFDVKIIFSTPEGEILRVGLNRPNSRYCKLVRDAFYGDKGCLDMDKANRAKAAEKGDTLRYTCLSGLPEAIKPIYFEGVLVGFIIMGQLRSGHEVPARVMADWSRTRPPRELEEAYLALPYIPPEKIGAIVDLFSTLAEHILLKRMIVWKSATILDDVVSYMESHVQEKLSVAQVARVFFITPWTLTRLFKKNLGKPSSQVFIEIKLRKAEEFMISNPEATVGEAAAKVGFADPLYFSRIYKRYRGIPPSTFLERCRLSRQG